jgi:hypothetical protein
VPAVACKRRPEVSPASLPLRRNGSLSHLLISAYQPSGTDATRTRLPCHPPSWLGAASHTCFHYLHPQQLISHAWPHHCLPGVVQARTMLLYVSGQLARTSCAWSACRSRLALAMYGGLDFIISKWASYFSYRSLICNPLMSLRSHCSKVALLA